MVPMSSSHSDTVLFCKRRKNWQITFATVTRSIISSVRSASLQVHELYQSLLKAPAKAANKSALYGCASRGSA